MSALDNQVGGSHYKDCAIQPIEFITANKLGFIEGNIVKYITRWREKGGIQDLEKVRHYVDLLIELETRQSDPRQPELDLDPPRRHTETEVAYPDVAYQDIAMNYPPSRFAGFIVSNDGRHIGETNVSALAGRIIMTSRPLLAFAYYPTRLVEELRPVPLIVSVQGWGVCGFTAVKVEDLK